MDLTGSTRTTAAAVSAAMLGGLALTLHGVIYEKPAHSLGGVAVLMVTLTAVILIVIRRWVTDTNAERIALIDAQREAQAEQSRYVALRAALEGEMGRRTRALAAERAALDARLRTERAALQAEFDGERDELACKAMEVALSWVHKGKLRPPEKPNSNLIRFPKQQMEPQPERERSREHGVVGP